MQGTYHVSDRSVTDESDARPNQATRGANAFERIPVWIRPLTNGCLVRMEGRDKVDWLLRRLSQSFVFKTSEPIVEDENSTCSLFRLAYSSRMPRRKLERLLATMPEIHVALDAV
jgi:hypothetical protein